MCNLNHVYTEVNSYEEEVDFFQLLYVSLFEVRVYFSKASGIYATSVYLMEVGWTNKRRFKLA